VRVRIINSIVNVRTGTRVPVLMDTVTRMALYHISDTSIPNKIMTVSDDFDCSASSE